MFFVRNGFHNTSYNTFVHNAERSCEMNNYTLKGYIVPVEFCIYFLPRIKGASKGTKMHLNEYRLSKS